MCVPLLLAAMSALVMLLWNAILPDVLHTGTISFWQAAGIFILSRILFGWGGPQKRGFNKMRRFKESWCSEEDKLRFRNEWQRRCRKPEKPVNEQPVQPGNDIR